LIDAARTRFHDLVAAGYVEVMRRQPSALLHTFVVAGVLEIKRGRATERWLREHLEGAPAGREPGA
jgi:hypothetical protein